MKQNGKNTTSSSHMNKRPPRNILTADPETPHQHMQQRPGEEITEWVTYEGGDVDPLEVPDAVRRPGFVCQWKAKSIVGKPNNEHMTRLHRAGWRAVPGHRGVGYFFVGDESVSPTIEIGGSILMERPDYIEAEARAQAKRKAADQVNDKLREIGYRVPENVRDKVIQHKVVNDSVGYMADLAVPEE